MASLFSLTTISLILNSAKIGLVDERLLQEKTKTFSEEITPLIQKIATQMLTPEEQQRVSRLVVNDQKACQAFFRSHKTPKTEPIDSQEHEALWRLTMALFNPEKIVLDFPDTALKEIFDRNFIHQKIQKSHSGELQDNGKFFQEFLALARQLDAMLTASSGAGIAPFSSNFTPFFQNAKALLPKDFSQEIGSLEALFEALVKSSAPCEVYPHLMNTVANILIPNSTLTPTAQNRAFIALFVSGEHDWSPLFATTGSSFRGRPDQVSLLGVECFLKLNPPATPLAAPNISGTNG